MSGKVDLDWTEDRCSISVKEENDEGTVSKYKPLIMINFTLLGYVSCRDHPYRGYQVLIKTFGGNDFVITVSEREIQR